MKYCIASVLLSLLSIIALADTYSALKQDNQTSSFSKVEPGNPIVFPRDHLAHPNFRIEWWYFTANVWDENQQHYGLQFTLFRQALAAQTTTQQSQSPWQSEQSWMAHAAITNTDGHHYEERFARGGIGQAGVNYSDEKQFQAWLDDWQWTGQRNSPIPGKLSFSINGQKISLNLNGQSSWIKHGDNGYSKKSPQQASYYYTHPNIQVNGLINTETGKHMKIQGTGWLDREWSSQFLAQQQKGWDWFSFQMHDGSRLMLFQLRDEEQQPEFKSGTWIDLDGNTTHLTNDDIHLTPLETIQIGDRIIPIEWQVTVRPLNKNWIVEARHKNSWLDTLFPYWEGPTIIRNSQQDSTEGVGFLEMTGY